MAKPSPATTAGCRFLPAAPFRPACWVRRGPCVAGLSGGGRSHRQGGLESYYLHRSDTAINPQALPQELSEEMALYDRKDVQQPFVQHRGELASTSLMIEGISCAACGWLIERHLRNLKGVAEANLNLSNHRLNVRWSDAQLPLSELLGELRRIGYAAHRIRPTGGRTPASENRRSLRQLGVTGLLWMQVMMATMATGRSSTGPVGASSSPSAGPRCC